MNGIETNSSRSPVRTVCTIIIDSDQHVFTGSRHKKKKPPKTIEIIKQLLSFWKSSVILSLKTIFSVRSSKYHFPPSNVRTPCYLL